jgi:hypothetical protein
VKGVIDARYPLGTTIKREVCFVVAEDICEGGTESHGVHPLPDGILGIELEGAVEVSYD